MGFSYLKGGYWKDITREERFFCSHLYHGLLNEESKKVFIKLLKENNSPAENIPLTSLASINIEDEWEAGYEVCFYRDLLLKFGISVKKNELEIAGKEKMIKRTFDLCLFSKNDLIIIEAKCLSNLDKKQYSDFGLDKQFITTIYDYLKYKGKCIEMPANIYTVFLAPSFYYESMSFIKANGTGKKMIEDYGNNQGIEKFNFDKFISWKQIDEMLTTTLIPNIFKKANGDKQDIGII